jgi:hypothetical protein
MEDTMRLYGFSISKIYRINIIHAGIIVIITPAHIITLAIANAMASRQTEDKGIRYNRFPCHS